MWVIFALLDPADENQCESMQITLIKNKIKFSLNIRKFRMEQLQSHVWLTTSSYMWKYLRISSYIRKPFLVYDFATAPLWISLYMRKIWFLFYQCRGSQHRRWGRKHAWEDMEDHAFLCCRWNWLQGPPSPPPPPPPGSTTVIFFFKKV